MCLSMKSEFYSSEQKHTQWILMTYFILVFENMIYHAPFGFNMCFKLYYILFVN